MLRFAVAVLLATQRPAADGHSTGMLRSAAKNGQKPKSARIRPQSGDFSYTGGIAFHRTIHPMRRASALPKPPAGQALAETHVWLTLRTLFPYLWRYRLRVVAAISCLVAAKVANVGVPMIFKEMIDGLSVSQQALALPALLLALYGLLRFSTSAFTELREILFARVTQRAVRQVSLEVFRHLHALSLRFHLERQTGGVSRDIERGSRSISSLISYTLYSILPTLVEIGLVLGILFVQYDAGFVVITLISLTAYIVYTVQLSNWRIDIRRAVNENDSAANTRAVDSLLNYETVKYFNNEAWEARRYDEQLCKWEEAATRSQSTLAYLNLGQAAIIALSRIETNSASAGIRPSATS